MTASAMFCRTIRADASRQRRRWRSTGLAHGMAAPGLRACSRSMGRSTFWRCRPCNGSLWRIRSGHRRVHRCPQMIEQMRGSAPSSYRETCLTGILPQHRRGIRDLSGRTPVLLRHGGARGISSSCVVPPPASGLSCRGGSEDLSHPRSTGRRGVPADTGRMPCCDITEFGGCLNAV